MAEIACGIEQVVRGAGQRGEQGLEPSPRSRLGFVASTGAAIRRRSSAMRASDPRRPRHAAGFPHPCAHSATGAVEIRIVDAAGDALALQRRRRSASGMLGVIERHLQQRENVFEPVIGRQRGVERRRLQLLSPIAARICVFICDPFVPRIRSRSFAVKNSKVVR